MTVLPWLLAGLLSSVLALLQYTGHAAALAPWVNWAPAGDAFANLRQRNQFASLTNIALAALVAALLAGRTVTVVDRPGSAPESARRTAPPWLINVAIVAAVALLVVGNAASSSRTGLLQLLVLAVMCAAWHRERRVLGWLAWASVCYLFGMFALPWLTGLDPATHGMFARLREGDPLCASRLTLWRNVLQLIGQHPWLGWGWGELDFAHYTALYPGPRFCDILDNAHNLPLHLAVELGVPVALLVCGGIVWWVLRSRPWRETDPLRQMAWMVLAMIAIHSLLEYPLWYAPFQLACGLSLGLLWRRPTQPAVLASARAKVGATATVLLAALLFVSCAYAAWDYWRISQIYRAPMLRDPAYRLDTLTKIQGSWLFARQVRFAELSTTALTLENAERVHALALELLHFSPEARVVEQLIESAQLLGLNDEAGFHMVRFRAAFPAAYAQWAGRRAR